MSKLCGNDWGAGFRLLGKLADPQFASVRRVPITRCPVGGSRHGVVLVTTFGWVKSPALPSGLLATAWAGLDESPSRWR